MDPRFQPQPPHYSQLQLHRQVQAPPVEVNELGPTIQQGLIQCPVEETQPNKETRFQVLTKMATQSGRDDTTSFASGLEENGRSNLRSHSVKVFPEGYHLTLNEAA